MNIALNLERRVRVEALYADIRRNVECLDELGLELAANHVDHALAIIEAETCPESIGIDVETLTEAMLARA